MWMSIWSPSREGSHWLPDRRLNPHWNFLNVLNVLRWVTRSKMRWRALIFLSRQGIFPSSSSTLADFMGFGDGIATVCAAGRFIYDSWCLCLHVYMQRYRQRENRCLLSTMFGWWSCMTHILRIVDITNQLFFPAEEKMDIVKAAVNAAAAAERPNLRMNGTEGLDSNLAGVLGRRDVKGRLHQDSSWIMVQWLLHYGCPWSPDPSAGFPAPWPRPGDLLALASAAFSAGFTDQEVAIFKIKWQEAVFSQRLHKFQDMRQPRLVHLRVLCRFACSWKFVDPLFESCTVYLEGTLRPGAEYSTVQYSINY